MVQCLNVIALEIQRVLHHVHPHLAIALLLPILEECIVVTVETYKTYKCLASFCKLKNQINWFLSESLPFLLSPRKGSIKLA
jgi:hypothetical protein